MGRWQILWGNKGGSKKAGVREIQWVCLHVFQSSPLPPIDEFDPKNYLDQVADTDSAGNKIPDWKRHMVAKNLAQKAHEEYLEQKKVST